MNTETNDYNLILNQNGEDAPVISDEEIEALLFSDEEMLPEKAVKRISPSRRAFLLTVWGLALSSLQLPLFSRGMQFAFNEYSDNAMGFPFLGLILPFAGLLLSLFGLRTLKKVNRAFGFSYALLFVRAALLLMGLVFTFSVLHEGGAGRVIALILSSLCFFSMLALIFGVYAGFRNIRSRIGFEPRSGEFIALAAWYLLRIALTVSGIPIKQNLTFLMFAMQALYLIILLALHLLTQSFDAAGYSVRTQAARVSAWLLSAASILGVVCTLLFSFCCLGKYRVSEVRLDASETNTPEQEQKAAEITQAREALIELGIPEYVVNDISDEELGLFKDPLRAAYSDSIFRLYSKENTATWLMSDNGSVSIEYSQFILNQANTEGGGGNEWWNGFDIDVIPIGTENYPVKLLLENGTAVGATFIIDGDIRVTTVIVELAGETEPLKRYASIHYFEYSPSVDFIGTEAIRINPLSYYAQEVTPDSAASGRLLYERGGEKYSAPYNSLQSPEVGGSNYMTEEEAHYGRSPDKCIYAGFSVPNGAEKVRCYIAYSVKETEYLDAAYFNAGYTLVHQRTAANPSGKTAYELIRYNSRMADIFAWVSRSILFDRRGMKVE